MSDRDSGVRRAADELERLSEKATPGPWSVEGEPGRWRALVSPEPHRARRGRPGWRQEECDYYGGFLVAETITDDDRVLMTVMRNTAPHLSDLLRALADEDPIAAGVHGRRLAQAALHTYSPHPDAL